MNCEPYIRLVPDADTAVLFIHGIAGSPRHFDKLLPLVACIPREWSVYNLSLPGHGGSVWNFGRSSMAQWKAYSEEVFLNLAKTHKKVLLVGHSMGSLFCIQLGCQYPGKIAGMFLLGVPIRAWLRVSGIFRMIRLMLGRLREDDPADMAFLQAAGVDATWKLWLYLGWVPRLLELLVQMHRTGKIVNDLRIPATVFQFERDEMVHRCSAKLLEKNPVIQVNRLRNSGHFYYPKDDERRMLESFREIIQTLKKHD